MPARAVNTSSSAPWSLFFSSSCKLNTFNCFPLLLTNQKPSANNQHQQKSLLFLPRNSFALFSAHSHPFTSLLSSFLPVFPCLDLAFLRPIGSHHFAPRCSPGSLQSPPQILLLLPSKTAPFSCCPHVPIAALHTTRWDLNRGPQGGNLLPSFAVICHRCGVK
eukprot:Sdes_comp17980_c0_seq1m7240